jgi:DNA-binding Lrp family transcriptional regulator
MDSDCPIIPERGSGSDDAEPVMHGKMTVVDELDQKIIVALQQDGRASWRTIADVVGASVSTVSRRGQQLQRDGVLRVAAVPALGSRGETELFLVRITCRPGKLTQVASALVANPDVRFITIVTGHFDIIAEMVMRGGATRYAQLMREMQQTDGVRRWRSDLMMHVFKVSNDWSSQLFADSMNSHAAIPASRGSADPDLCSPEHFDEQDHQIVAALNGDGRRSFNAIADELGMNESSVRRRFDRLRQRGCIDILTLVPAAALGMGAEVLLMVTVSPGELESVAHELEANPAVRYLAATLDENSLFCEVIAVSVPELYKFISGTLSHMKGVLGWNASMELLFLKRGFVETPWGQANLVEVESLVSSAGELAI